MKNGNDPEVKVVAPEVKRVRASGPILLLAILFVGGAFLSWYFSWFGRSLSDADISEYLVDEQRPRHVQHALLQIQERIERGDQSAKQWYPQIIRLTEHSETEFRLTVAWLMGFDNKSEEFHQALLKLIKDSQPIVRRNAALALVRFNDASGHPELRSILTPHEVKSPVEGEVASTLNQGSQLARGTLLARITQPDGKAVEVRAPIPGKLEAVVAPTATKVTPETTLVRINSDEDSVWEALRALALIGTPEDLTLIDRYAQDPSQTERIRRQATVTGKAIQSRSKP